MQKNKLVYTVNYGILTTEIVMVF